MADEDDLQAVTTEYMRACIRAHNPRDIHTWTRDELVYVFNAVPVPAVSLGDWIARMKPLTAVEAPAASVEPTEEQKEQNQHFVEWVEQAKTDGESEPS